jgi:ribonucleotide reductase beta subunit family protein with ferritin-like domain
MFVAHEDEGAPSQNGAKCAEPLLQDNPDRYCMFPIKYRAVWEMYKKAEASFWTGNNVNCCV